MPRRVNVKGVSSPTMYRKRFADFRGVDFSTDPTQVADCRAAYAENIVSDLAGFPEKRPGWRTLLTVEQPVNGLFYAVFPSGRGVFFIHGGTKLYTWDGDQTATQIASDLANHRSCGFNHSGYLFLLEGTHYMMVTESETTDGGVTTYSYSKALVKDNAFVPTTVVSTPAAGGGMAFEAVNLLTGKRKNSMIGDGTSTIFYLDTQEIDSVDRVSVEGEEVAATEYTVDLTAGTVTFITAPMAYSGGSGVDNVVIEFTKVVAGYAERIEECTTFATYGLNNDNRLFFSGNPNKPNTDWQSGLMDPTYFPDTGYTKIGSDGSAIMGYLKQGDSLLVVKSEDGEDAELYLRTAEINESGEVSFPIRQGAKGVGAISAHAFASLRDDPLFLSREGVCAVISSEVTGTRALQDRSYYVNARLREEGGLNNAVAAVWNGYYLLSVNGHVYLADGRQKTGNSETEQYGYEWYYWTNVPARVFFEHEGTLYFGTESGKVCRFNTDIAVMSRYEDDDDAITAVWATRLFDLGTIARRKTLTKKGCGVMIKPYTRSSVDIYIRTDRTHESLICASTMDILNFADIDFERLTFNTLDTPQVKAFNKKVKQFIVLQLVFKNVAKDEGFGIYGAEVQYTLDGYVK